jgi:hypothetical protein
LLDNNAGSLFKDLYLSGTAIQYSLLISFVFCIVYIYAVSLFAEYIAWLIIFVLQISFIGGSAACFYKWKIVNDSNLVQVYGEKVHKEDTLKMLMIGGCILGVLGLLFFCFVVCGYKSLKIAIDVVDASADFLARTKRILVVPIFFFFVQAFVICAWIPGMTCIYTLSFTNIEKDPKIP